MPDVPVFCRVVVTGVLSAALCAFLASFDGPILEVEDGRRDYGGMRFLALGELAGQYSTSFILGAADR